MVPRATGEVESSVGLVIDEISGPDAWCIVESTAGLECGGSWTAFPGDVACWAGAAH